MPNPSISVAGTQWGADGAGQLTCGVNPVNVGDLMVLTFQSFGSSGATAVSGGGVTTWTQASSYYDNSGTFGITLSESIWWGVVTTAGLSTITVTDAALGTNFSTLWAREYTATGASWALVTASPPAGTVGGVPGTSGNTPSYPSLTDSGGNDLYIGASTSYFGHMTAGSTAGFVYEVAGGNNSCQACYDTSAGGTVQPNSANTDSGSSLLIAAIFTAGGGGGGGTPHTRTASLTVTPSFTASRTRGKFRTGSLAVAPSFSASRTMAHVRRGSLLVPVSFSASRQVAHVRTGTLLVVPSFRAVPSGGAAPAVQQGSWWGLVSVLRHSRQEFESYISRPPVACPNCGEPLTNAPTTASGSGVQLFCKFDGWQFPRDWHPPTRPVTGAGAW